jgi:hypothetical protein
MPEYLRYAIRLDEVDKAALAACRGDAPGVDRGQRLPGT